MSEKRKYGGLDWFRIISAILVITIHTSPLLSFGEWPDFILTRVIARVAVPFFLMVSGFFVLPEIPETKDLTRLFRQLKRLGLLYIIAMVLYVPIMIYSGYFGEGFSLAGLCKDILINGTFYHLWYLPAAIFGLFFVGILLRYCKDWVVLLLSGGFYVLGLLGDSYYGLTRGIPVLKEMYDGIFSVSDYTRNGLFFVPVFLMLGYYLKKQEERRSRISTSYVILGLSVSGVFMLMEGLLLHFAGWQRHDSMYLFLPLVMLFLFMGMCRLEITGGKRLGRIAMLVYILHPAMIVAVRLAGKLTGLTKWVVDQSLIHFILVTIASFIAAYILTIGMNRNRKKEPTGRGGNRY